MITENTTVTSAADYDKPGKVGNSSQNSEESTVSSSSRIIGLYYDENKIDKEFFKHFCDELKMEVFSQMKVNLDLVQLEKEKLLNVDEDRILCALYVADVGDNSRVINRVDSEVFRKLSEKTGSHSFSPVLFFFLLFFFLLLAPYTVSLLILGDQTAFVFFRNKETTLLNIGDMPSRVGGENYQLILRRVDGEYDSAWNNAAIRLFVKLLLDSEKQ
jgi:hypothetical protein